MPWREQFPALDDDIDRRIDHSEGRIKYWVIGGILANLVALIGVGVPLVYIFGTMQQQSSNTLATVVALQTQVSQLELRLRREEIHTLMIDTWAVQKGYAPDARVGVGQ